MGSMEAGLLACWIRLRAGLFEEMGLVLAFFGSSFLSHRLIEVAQCA